MSQQFTTGTRGPTFGEIDLLEMSVCDLDPTVVALLFLFGCCRCGGDGNLGGCRSPQALYKKRVSDVKREGKGIDAPA